MKYRHFLSAILLALASAVTAATSTDLYYPPTTSAGHDFNHAPLGQTFKALVPDVKAGIYIADQYSFTDWLRQMYPTLPDYPYAVAQSVSIRVDLLRGAGTGGSVVDSRVITLNRPFMGFVEVDYAADGIALAAGNDYTLLMTDVSGQSYPNGVTGWVVPAVTDSSGQAALPPGAYADGQPILQGAVVSNDAGIGDNSFEVLDMGGVAPAPLVISGTLPYAQVGQPYSAALAASGGVPPYDWVVSGLPPELALDPATGVISGTPATAGSYPVGVTVYDSRNDFAAAQYTLVVSDLSCVKPRRAKASKGKGTVTAVGAGYIKVGSKQIDYASCTAINFGGYATEPTVGDRVEWQGFLEGNGNVMAQVLTFN